MDTAHVLPAHLPACMDHAHDLHACVPACLHGHCSRSACPPARMPAWTMLTFCMPACPSACMDPAQALHACMPAWMYPAHILHGHCSHPACRAAGMPAWTMLTFCIPACPHACMDTAEERYQRPYVAEVEDDLRIEVPAARFVLAARVAPQSVRPNDVGEDGRQRD
eukprot:177555-Chlamydomonas_euryale.AAC.4